MATSPNYGFPEPDNSSLVKNGAQDIRALGDAIDAFLFRPFSKNAVINGGMDIWQRGTAAVTTASVYTADRWQKDGQTTSSVSRETTSDTTNLPNIQYCIRVARTNGDSNTLARGVYQAFETVNSFPFVGKTITVSYYARKGSSFTGSMTLRFMTGTGTDQACNFGTSMTGQVNNDVAITSTLTTTWQRFTSTFTVPTTATQIAVGFRHAPTGTTSNTNDYFELTGVQLEAGSSATEFSRNAATIQQELAACQRYYIRFGADNAFTRYGIGFATGADGVNAVIPLKVTMRTAPTTIEYADLAAYDTAVIGTPSAVTQTGADRNMATINFVKSASFTQYRPYQIIANSSTSAYLAFSAEL